MATKSTKNAETKKNNLTTPLCISLAANVILLIAVFCLAVWGTGTKTKLEAAQSSSAAAETTAAETQSAETEAAETAAAETTTADAEEETFYFTDENDEEVEVVAYDAYINGEFICAGDASDWTFTYDEETEATSVYVVDEDGEEVGTYNVDFYATTDEENAQLVCYIHNDDDSVSFAYYVQNILDSDSDDAQNIGIYFVNVTDSSNQVTLYSPEAYQTYVVDGAAAETESAETETVETATASAEAQTTK